jgi:periplasmic protein CpxP/Spy
MRRKLMMGAVMTAALIGTSTTVVLAERGPLPGFGGPPPGMEAVGENFEARMATILKLTETQKHQIKALLDAERQLMEPLQIKMHESREKIKLTAEANVFEEGAVRAVAVAQSQIEVELIVSRARTLNKVNALLTPDQRELLSNLLPEPR